LFSQLYEFFTKVDFPFADGFTLPHGNVNGNVNGNGDETKKIILNCVRQNPNFTLENIAENTGVSKRIVSRCNKRLG